MYSKITNEQFLDDLGAALGRPLSDVQRESVAAILQAVDEYGIEDPKKVAYVLGTCWHESRFKPIQEIRAKPGSPIWKMQNRYWPSGFFGRGFVQLTWRRNYAKFSELVGVDLVKEPDKALDILIGAKILVVGMAKGMFTGVSLKTFFNETKEDWFNARKIVNGTFHADKVANAALKILPVLLANIPEEV
jgi:putative chitinase